MNKVEDKLGAGCSGWLYRLLIGQNTGDAVSGAYSRNMGLVLGAKHLKERPSFRSQFVLRMIRWAHPQEWEHLEKVRKS